MAHLNFDVKLHDGADSISSAVVDLLSDYLQPDSDRTIQSTALAILDKLPKDAESDAAGPFVGVCIQFAEQIPYHHASQIKLASILKFLALAKKFTGSGTFSDSKEEMSAGFHPTLGWTLRDHLNGPDPKNMEAFINFHAFAAHLWSYRLPTTTGPLWSIWAMREAHEGGFAGGKPYPGLRNCQVMCAAQWIFWYGQGLFQDLLYPGDVTETDLRMWKPGPLYEGKAGFDLERWHFWRDGFRKVASLESGGNTDGTHGKEGEAKEEYTEECKNLAKKAASLMDTLESSLTF